MNQTPALRFSIFLVSLFTAIMLVVVGYRDLSAELVFLSAEGIFPKMAYGREPTLDDLMRQRRLLNVVLSKNIDETRYLLLQAVNLEAGADLKLPEAQYAAAYGEAAGHYKKIIKVQPSNSNAWASYALALSITGEASEGHIRSALKFGKWEPNLSLRICEAAYRAWTKLSYNTRREVRFYVSELVKKRPNLYNGIVSAMTRAGLPTEIRITTLDLDKDER